MWENNQEEENQEVKGNSDGAQTQEKKGRHKDSEKEQKNILGKNYR